MAGRDHSQWRDTEGGIQRVRYTVLSRQIGVELNERCPINHKRPGVGEPVGRICPIRDGGGGIERRDREDLRVAVTGVARADAGPGHVKVGVGLEQRAVARTGGQPADRGVGADKDGLRVNVRVGRRHSPVQCVVNRQRFRVAGAAGGCDWSVRNTDDAPRRIHHQVSHSETRRPIRHTAIQPSNPLHAEVVAGRCR